MQVSFRPYYDMSEWLCIHSITLIPSRIVICGFHSKEARILKEYISGRGLTHTEMERGSPRLY